MPSLPLSLSVPQDVQRQLATRVRALRLARSWKQSTLAERAGVSLPTVQRYEQTGRTSVETLLRLCHALGRLDEFTGLLEPAPASSLTPAYHRGPARAVGLGGSSPPSTPVEVDRADVPAREPGGRSTMPWMVAPLSPARTLKIVLTGGPGGGKTTAADMLRREFAERVVLVPETATMLFSGGFPRVDDPDARRAAQTAIFHVQRNLEQIQAARFPDRILLCDRGTIDGVAYWPEGSDFFASVGTTLEAELARYHHVIFFESAAVGGLSIASGNPTRIESNREALTLDRSLRTVWSRHPSFQFVPHGPSFLAKITAGLHALTEILAGARHG